MRALLTFANFYALCFALLPKTFADDFASNWHQWRGPNATGWSPTAEPPVLWSERQNVKWKVSIEGQGTSTPIVWNNRVFILTAVRTEEKDESIPDPKDQPKTNFFDIKKPNRVHDFVVLCLDRNTGRQIWRRVATRKIPHEGAHNDNDFASASPTTDGKRLFCWFGSAGMYCFDLEGNLLWERDLGEASISSSLGEGSSPVVHQNRLVVVRDHAGQSSITVLDTLSGDTVWEKKRDEGNAWSTPIVTERNQKTQIITAASGFVRSYDLKTGDIIWKCSGLTGNVTPSPIVFDNSVICMSGYQGYSSMSISLDAEGDLTKTDSVRWKLSDAAPYIPSPLLMQDSLFFAKSNQSILFCINAESGKSVFGPHRIGDVSNIYASIVGADGRVYVLGRNGTTLVLEQSKSFKELSTNKLEDRFDASPALAGKQLFLRGAKSLYCIEDQTR